MLNKYYNNKCTEEELNSVLTWFSETARTSDGKDCLFELWNQFPDEDADLDVDFDLILNRIHHQVNLAGSKKLLEEAGQDLLKYRWRQRFLSIITRAAAVLMLPVLAFSLYMLFRYQSVRHAPVSVNQAYNEVFSSVDAITKVTLPDGSDVWLNHSSSLKYPAVFRGRTRDVELSGEGYFKVVSNSKVPFIVKAGDLQILARGTTFNVMAYPEEDKIETSLIEGIVEIQKASPGRRAASLVTMNPTDLSVYHKVKEEVLTSTINDDRYFAWRYGRLVFNEEPLDEVARKLSRWFNVDIRIADTRLLDFTYTATFEKETLPQVLELMSLVSPVRYSVSEREKTIDDTFTKRKVILTYINKQSVKNRTTK